MLEILVVVIAMLVMARNPRRRKWTADMKAVPFTEGTALLTLATVTVITATTLPVSDNEYRVLGVRNLWSIRGFTPSEGPIVVGYAHGDYSVSEIKQSIEAETMMTRGDKIAAEQGNRLVRRVGMFAGNIEDETINDGKPIYTRLNWVIPVGKTLNAWAYNQSGASLTTGSVLIQNGKATIKWL